MQQLPFRHPSWLTPVAGGLFGMIMLLLIHRYVGINHDSILYLGQGMARHWPQIFSKDLFFIHGSQEHYSVFPWLLDLALGWASPTALFMWGSAAGLAAFFSAGWYCLRTLLPPGQRYWAWLATICLPSVYGMVQMFSFGEKFLTSRPFAEAFCLLAIACISHKRAILAALCIALAGILHPLQALASTLIIWPWLVIHDRRWIHALWLGLLVLPMKLSGIKPFDGVFLRIDPVWLYNLHDATAQIFLSKWGAADYSNLIFDASILFLAHRSMEPKFARWCGAALIGLTLGFFSSAILVDGLDLAFPAALQIWRVHWLAHWVAIASLTCLLHRDLQTRNLPRAALLTLAAIYAWGDGTWVWPPIMLLYTSWPTIARILRPAILNACTAIFVTIVTVLTIIYATTQWQWFAESGYRLDLYPIDRLLLAYPVLGFGLPLLMTALWTHARTAGLRLFLTALLIPLVLVAGCKWDSRSLTNRVFESNEFNPDIFGIHIPENAQVFWYPGSILGSWLVLQRASYFSPGQVAGEIFSRQTAIDARTRIERLRPLFQQGLGCDQARLAGTYTQECVISARHMRRACERGKDLAPDFIILPYHQPQPAAGSWRLVDPAGLQPESRLWLYRCNDILTATAAHG